MKRIEFTELPERAREYISDEQQSYIDEFRFYEEAGVFYASYGYSNDPLSIRDLLDCDFDTYVWSEDVGWV